MRVQHKPIQRAIPKQIIPAKNKNNTNCYDSSDSPDFTDSPNLPDFSNCEEDCDKHGQHQEKSKYCCPGPKGDKGDRGAPGIPETKIVFSSDIMPPNVKFTVTTGGLLGSPGTTWVPVATSLGSTSTVAIYLIPTLPVTLSTIASYTFIVPQIGYIKDLKFSTHLNVSTASSSNSYTYSAYVFRSTAITTNGTAYLDPGYFLDTNLTTSVTFSNLMAHSDYTANNSSNGPPLLVSEGDQIGIFINGSNSANVGFNGLSMSATITYVPR